MGKQLLKVGDKVKHISGKQIMVVEKLIKRTSIFQGFKKGYVKCSWQEKDNKVISQVIYSGILKIVDEQSICISILKESNNVNSY